MREKTVRYIQATAMFVVISVVWPYAALMVKTRLDWVFVAMIVVCGYGLVWAYAHLARHHCK